MTVKDTIPIIFNGGAYGTYLEYCLDTFTCQGSQTFQGLPFNTTTGNSHRYTGNHLLGMDGWQNYITTDAVCKFVRLHPKKYRHESVKDNVLEILSVVDRAILLYPTESTTILNLNNYYFKIWRSWINHQFGNEIPIDILYHNWPISAGTPIDQIPPWIVREFLSLYLVPAWYSQVDWNLLENFTNEKLLIITIPELLFNDINQTMIQICNFCNLDFTNNTEKLSSIHQTMLSCQTHLYKDELCRKIVKYVFESQNFHYGELTMVDEAWIQWQLRELGYELQCDGLNQFPSSTIELASKIYRV
jgi:hypothetical protein